MTTSINALLRANDTFKNSANTITSKSFKELRAIISDRNNYSTGILQKELKKGLTVIDAMIELYSEGENDIENILPVIAVYDQFYLNDKNLMPSTACMPFASFLEKDKLLSHIKALKVIDRTISQLEDNTFIQS